MFASSPNWWRNLCGFWKIYLSGREFFEAHNSYEVLLFDYWVLVHIDVLPTHLLIFSPCWCPSLFWLTSMFHWQQSPPLPNHPPHQKKKERKMAKNNNASYLLEIVLAKMCWSAFFSSKNKYLFILPIVGWVLVWSRKISQSWPFFSGLVRVGFFKCI